jgi:hypothetical protein
MCLITRQKVATVLEEDMVVYKEVRIRIMDGKILSPYCHFEWGNIYSEREPLEVIGYLEPIDISELKPFDPLFFDHQAKRHYLGEDAMSNIPDESREQIRRMGLTIIRKGFHFVLKTKRLNCDYHSYSSRKIGEFVVPKGAKVYYDETGIGVTDRIKFIKILK